MSKTFASLSDFADYLSLILSREEKFRLTFLDAVGRHVKDESKRKFGIYQDTQGPFVEWAELAESTQEQRERLGFSPNDPLYRTGGLMESVHYKVNNIFVSIGSNDPIMVYQELGTIHIPPRSVLGAAMWGSKDYIIKTLNVSIAGWLLNKTVTI